MKHRLLTLIVCAVLSSVSMWAQLGYRHNVVPAVAPDSVDLEYYGKKKFWQGAATVVGLNLGVWAFDRYVLEGDFAYISMNSVEQNFKHGFIWDNDYLGTNMFFHPYHGNLYFNAGRSNGFNYWQSGLYAFGGSAMWELFMECEYPSTNDIIATPIGGMAIGEVFYRASDLILDDRATGGERWGREIGAFVVSPMRGLTRVINGDAWRKRSTSGRQFGIPNMSIAVSAGARNIKYKGDVFDKGIGLTSQIDIEYGDRFSVDNGRPYDFFTLRGDISLMEGQPILGQLNIIGRLLNRGLVEKENTTLNIGMYQHYDFYDSDTISEETERVPYKFATPASAGCGMQFQQLNVGNWDFSAEAHVNGILMGGVLSDYYQLNDRNYNVASGFGTKVNLNALFKKNKFSATLSHEYYRMFTWKGFDPDVDLTTLDEEQIKTLDAQGAESQASMHISELRLDYQLAKHWFLTGSLQHFWRDTNYRHYTDVQSKSTSARLMATYVF